VCLQLKATWKLIPETLLAEWQTVVRLVDEQNEYSALIAEMSSTTVPGIPFVSALLPKIEAMEDKLPYVLQEIQGMCLCLCVCVLLLLLLLLLLCVFMSLITLMFL
jgi:hypothetical protein